MHFIPNRIITVSAITSQFSLYSWLISIRHVYSVCVFVLRPLWRNWN